MQPKCRSSLERKSLAFIVKITLDQYLANFTTYAYQIMQTGETAVMFASATPISAHQDNRARSSQVKIVSLSQITRCLDSSSDKTSAEKDLAGKIVKSQSIIDRMANSESTGRALLIMPPFLSACTSWLCIIVLSRPGGLEYELQIKH